MDETAKIRVCMKKGPYNPIKRLFVQINGEDMGPIFLDGDPKCVEPSVKLGNHVVSAGDSVQGVQWDSIDVEVLEDETTCVEAIVDADTTKKRVFARLREVPCD